MKGTLLGRVAALSAGCFCLALRLAPAAWAAEGYYHLTEITQSRDGDRDVEVQHAPGQVTITLVVKGERAVAKLTWTRPPDTLRPGQVIPITLSAQWLEYNTGFFMHAGINARMAGVGWLIPEDKWPGVSVEQRSGTVVSQTCEKKMPSGGGDADLEVHAGGGNTDIVYHYHYKWIQGPPPDAGARDVPSDAGVVDLDLGSGKSAEYDPDAEKMVDRGSVRLAGGVLPLARRQYASYFDLDLVIDAVAVEFVEPNDLSILLRYFDGEGDVLEIPGGQARTADGRLTWFPTPKRQRVKTLALRNSTDQVVKVKAVKLRVRRAAPADSSAPSFNFAGWDKERIHQVKPEGVAAGDGLPAGKYVLYIAPADGISIAYADWQKWAWKRYGPFDLAGGTRYELDQEGTLGRIAGTGVAAGQTQLRFMNTDKKQWYAFYVQPAGGEEGGGPETAPPGSSASSGRFAGWDKERIHQVKPEGVAAGDGLPAGKYVLYIAPADGISIAYADWQKWAWKRYGPFDLAGGTRYEVDQEGTPGRIAGSDIAPTQTRLRYVNTDPKRWFAFYVQPDGADVGGGAETPPQDPPRTPVGIAVHEVTDSELDQAGLPAGFGGLFVVSVVAGSAAAQAGVQAGDIVLGIEGKRLPAQNTREAFRAALQGAKSRTPLLSVWRNGKRETLTLKLDAAPPAGGSPPSGGAAGTVGLLSSPFPGGFAERARAAEPQPVPDSNWTYVEQTLERQTTVRCTFYYSSGNPRADRDDPRAKKRVPGTAPALLRARVMVFHADAKSLAGWGGPLKEVFRSLSSAYEDRLVYDAAHDVYSLPADPGRSESPMASQLGRVGENMVFIKTSLAEETVNLPVALPAGTTNCERDDGQICGEIQGDLALLWERLRGGGR